MIDLRDDGRQIMVHLLLEFTVNDYIFLQIEISKVRFEKVRKKYRPAAYRSANLFFCVADLANVEPMYQWSLDWFTELYIFNI